MRRRNRIYAPTGIGGIVAAPSGNVHNVHNVHTAYCMHAIVCDVLPPGGPFRLLFVAPIFHFGLHGTPVCPSPRGLFPPHTHLTQRNFTTSVIFSSVFHNQLVCSKVTLQVMSNAPVVALVIDSRHTFIRFVSIMYDGLCLSTKPCKLMC